MMNRAMSMTAVDSRPLCAVETMAYFAFMNAACFSVLRFYFYYFFINAGLSKRKQIS